MNNYYNAIFQIIKTGHSITDQVNTELKPLGFSEPQYNVLRILRGRGGKPATVMSIQADMVQRTSNVTRIIDKLINKGLVTRSQCAANRRKMDIAITKRGLEVLTSLDSRVEAIHKTMKQNITADEAETLTELIQKLKGQ